MLSKDISTQEVKPWTLKINVRVTLGELRTFSILIAGNYVPIRAETS